MSYILLFFIKKSFSNNLPRGPIFTKKMSLILKIFLNKFKLKIQRYASKIKIEKL